MGKKKGRWTCWWHWEEMKDWGDFVLVFQLGRKILIFPIRLRIFRGMSHWPRPVWVRWNHKRLGWGCLYSHKYVNIFMLSEYFLPEFLLKFLLMLLWMNSKVGDFLSSIGNFLWSHFTFLLWLNIAICVFQFAELIKKHLKATKAQSNFNLNKNNIFSIIKSNFKNKLIIRDELC
jgi:hypothetical protein